VTLTLDLKSADNVAKIRALLKKSHGLIEGFRPGVMERLGLGPDVLLADNPQLVYGRMTGWGQDGPLAPTPGHDINYIALNGVLAAIGKAGDEPVPPLNLLGDFGGGGMLLAFGMVAALLAVRNGAQGQVIDCAMTEGSALLMTMIWGVRASGAWREERGVNILDSGAACYDTYATADGKFMAVGAIEEPFYKVFLQQLGLADDPDLQGPLDAARWSTQKAKIAAVMRRHTRDELCRMFEGSEACVTPVLTMTECLAHPHVQAREMFVTANGLTQPAPAPRYSVMECTPPTTASRPEADAWLKAQGII
jgi:alpha-methylacyl-CoA racemase